MGTGTGAAAASEYLNDAGAATTGSMTVAVATAASE
jgi:hypothetical protein